jgi:adenylate cyclase
MSADPLGVDAIRECLEGSVPSAMATCAPDGTPNVTYTSQVEYVDEHHVALSFQFFNKTRDNILLNPRATVEVTHPRSGACFRLALMYLRTECEGRIFERMKAKLAGIASHTGMAGVFKLRGADIYRVLSVEAVPGPALPLPAPRRALLAALRSASARIADCADLEALFGASLTALVTDFDLRYVMFLAHDAADNLLYTMASRGYPQSGIGSEIVIGDGVIGVAAQVRTPIRIAHLTEEYSYHRAVRETAREAGLTCSQREIPFPGLPRPHSQLAVPIVAGARLLGVIYLESPDESRFGYDDEDALVVFAAQIAAKMCLLGDAEDPTAETEPQVAAKSPDAVPLTVRHYAEDHSVFLADDYLIKGVAGAILWKLLRDHQDTGRSQFTNRELRLDTSLRLPDIVDNLEARLILLTRRLAERSSDIAVERCGRGRFVLTLRRPVTLINIPRSGTAA